MDMCPPNVLKSALKLLQKTLKSRGCNKMPMLVNTADDVGVASESFVSERFALHHSLVVACQLLLIGVVRLGVWFIRIVLICFRRLCPIFQVSNVTGQNLDLVKMFLNFLKPSVRAAPVPDVGCTTRPAVYVF